jgi:hypothetical protein
LYRAEYSERKNACGCRTARLRLRYWKHFAAFGECEASARPML